VLDGSADRVADLIAPDGLLEFGFTVPGMPQRQEGREAVRSWLRPRLGQALRFEEYRNVRIHECLDPELLVIEHDITATSIATGHPHVMSYVYVLRARNGQIVHLRDYANVLVAAQALGGLDALLSYVACIPS
jgi:ketosteroid isomerase-like protein